MVKVLQCHPQTHCPPPPPSLYLLPQRSPTLSPQPLHPVYLKSRTTMPPIRALLKSSSIHCNRMCFCLQAHTDIRRLEFLPYHFLLASVGDLGVLRFQVRHLHTHRCTTPGPFVCIVIGSSVQSLNLCRSVTLTFVPCTAAYAGGKQACLPCLLLMLLTLWHALLKPTHVAGTHRLCWCLAPLPAL